MEQISDATVKENPSVKPTEVLTSDDTHPRETDSIHQPNDGTHLANIVKSEDVSFKSDDDIGDSDQPCDTSSQNVNESHDDSLTDEYHYLKTGEYTSEIYKVVIRNIPRGISYGRFRSTIQRILGSHPKKIKYHKGSHYAFLACCDEEQRQKALSLFNNYKWKDRVLTCKKAAPAHDPYVRERKRRIENGSNDRSSKKSKMSQNTSLPPEIRILHAVCPYVTYSYEEQIHLKEEEMERCISDLTGNMIKNLRGSAGSWLNKDKLCLQLLPIIRSPVVSQYRNKVEFTIGVGPDGKDNTIGFILGSYKAGTLAIVEASKCINCTLSSVAVAKEFQDFIQTLPYPSYNVGTHIGLWQQMTVRTCRSGDVMVIIQINGSYLPKEEQTERLKKDIEGFYLNDGVKNKVTSVYFSMSSKSNTLNVGTYQHLCFEKHIYEELLQLKFRISPDAFFQVNTPATELLYTQVFDWCDTQQDDACVLDVCCGTGTIGLCIAKKTSLPVIGVEICEQAVEDARHNAAINDISNVQFVCGPAEKVLQKEIQKITKKNIIAVVDPPRAGLHGNVITLLRNCRAIKRIIYVACNAKMASQNFVSLCRPRSKRFEGAPFKTVRAVPIDLFPQTPHCELIVELERVDIEQDGEWPQLKSSENINIAVTSCDGGMNKDTENTNANSASVDSKSTVDNTDTCISKSTVDNTGTGIVKTEKHSEISNVPQTE